MTRNEFIAETAARLLASEEVGSVDSAIKLSVTLANSLESANVAPWLTPPAPALDPLIERAHLFATFCACGEYAAGDMKARAQSWLADYDAAKSRQTPAPELTDAARRVIEAAVGYFSGDHTSMSEKYAALNFAVRAYKESAK